MVVALRDRVQTLKEMAEKAAVWFQPLLHVRRRGRHQAPDGERRARRWPMRANAWRQSPGGRSKTSVPRCDATAEALGLGMGKVAQPLRVAITGTQVSPDIATYVYLAGRAKR